jgi:hypothetical protein
MRSAVLSLALLAALAVPAAAAPRPGTPAAAPPPRSTDLFDLERRYDFGDLDFFVTNFGTLAYDIVQGNSGLEFPRGSGKFAIFASGLWVGAKVDGTPRVTVAEYSSEWTPGKIAGGPTDDEALRTWKVITLPAVSLL